MTILILDGWITDQGALEVELPKAVPPGAAKVTIEIGEPMPAQGSNLPCLEIAPLSGQEILAFGLAGTWSEAGIRDSAEWLADQRQAKRSRLSW